MVQFFKPTEQVAWKMDVFKRNFSQSFTIPPRPWITRLYKLAITMYSQSHGKLPQYGVQFKTSKQNSFPCISLPKINRKGFLLYAFGICQHLLTFCTLILKHRNVKSHQLKYTTLDILQTSFLIISTIWLGWLSDLFRFVFFMERKSVACTFKTLITANQFTNTTVSIYKDYSGWLLVYLQFGLWIFGTPLPFILRYGNMDPWFVIFQELGFNQGVWFLWTLSFILSIFHDKCVVQRDLVPELLICFAFVLSGESHMVSIQKATKSYPNNISGLKAYITLMIICKRLSVFKSCLSGCCVVYSTPMLSLFCWISVNCFRIVPLFMVAMSWAAFIRAAFIRTLK